MIKLMGDDLGVLEDRAGRIESIITMLLVSRSCEGAVQRHRKKPIDHRSFAKDTFPSTVCLRFSHVSFVTRPYLGVLELTALETLWGRGGLDAKSVHGEIGVRRGYYPARNGREDAVVLARAL